MWSNMQKVKVPQIAPIPKSQPTSYQPPSLPPSTAVECPKVISAKPQKVLEDEETPAMVEQLLNGGPEDPIASEEVEVESMLKLMEEIQNVRETNKHLGDAERRQNAEKIMLKLAAMMDLGSDAEEDYGEEDGAFDD